MFSFLKYSIMSEAVSVKKQNYSWGKMITIHHGSDTSYPLHPEHQAKIKALGDGEKTSFKDETKRTVTAQRVGDQIHLSSLGSLKKASVARSHFTEEVEPIEELSKTTLASYAKKAVTDARFKQGIGKDYEALGKRKRDPDTKAMFARMGRKVRMKAQSREQGAAKAIDRLAKEEVEIEEAQDINYHRTELKKTSDKIDSIVKGGGKVGLNDPLSKKLKLHSAQIKKLKEEIKQIDEESLTAGKRLISKHGEGSHTARVYKDTEYNEYQVHHYKDGKHMGEGPISYHDDKEDAEDTAKMSLRKRMKEEIDLEETSLVKFSTDADSYPGHIKQITKIHKSLRTDHPDKVHKSFGGDGTTGFVKVKNKAHIGAVKDYIKKAGGKIEEKVEIAEISKELLSRYKERAGAQASNLNRAVDAVATSSAAPEHKKAAIDALVKKGNKRFSGIIRATNKQFAKEEKDKNDVPFTPDKPKSPSAKAGKYGLGYSTAKHLARMALSQQVKKKQDRTS